MLSIYKKRRCAYPCPCSSRGIIHKLCVIATLILLFFFFLSLIQHNNIDIWRTKKMAVCQQNRLVVSHHRHFLFSFRLSLCGNGNMKLASNCALDKVTSWSKKTCQWICSHHHQLSLGYFASQILWCAVNDMIWSVSCLILSVHVWSTQNRKSVTNARREYFYFYFYLAATY